MDTKKIDKKAEIFSTYIKTINYDNRPPSDKRLSHQNYVNNLSSTFDVHLGTEAKGWLSMQNSSFLKHFFTLTITEKHLLNCFKFFKNDIKCDIKDLQIELAKYAEWFKYTDTLTSDPDVFFRSLITQFLYIVKPSTADDFELQNAISKITVDDTPENLPASQTNAIKLMKDVFFYGIVKYNIAYYINHIKPLVDSCYYFNLITFHFDISKMESAKFDLLNEENEGPRSSEIIDLKEINYNFLKDVDDFLKYIYLKIMTTFTPYQYETTYSLIDEFCDILNKFRNSFINIGGKLMKEFYELYNDREELDLRYSQFQDEINKINDKIQKLQNKTNTDETVNLDNSENLEKDLYELQYYQEQISYLSSVLSYRDDMCSLFKKISGGIPLLIQSKQ